MRSLFFAAATAVVSSLASAQTVYFWEDTDGVHYTDDPSQVPKDAKVEAAALKVRTPVGEPAAAAPTVPTTVPSGAQYAKGERDWRDRFIAAHRKIGTAKQTLAALEENWSSLSLNCQVPPTGSTTQLSAGPAGGRAAPVEVQTVAGQQPPCHFGPAQARLRVQIDQAKVQAKDAELDLEQLERQASLEGVPREWRRGW